jgi:hypothetical protein
MKTSLLLAAGSLGSEAYVQYVLNSDALVSNLDTLTGIAYLPGGDGLIAVSELTTTESVGIYYQYAKPGADILKTQAVYEYTTLKLAPSTYPDKIALSPAKGSLRNLFTTTYSTILSGTVQFYQGEYSTWSVQQVLSPPNYIRTSRNLFGSTLTFDRDNYDTLFIGSNTSATTASVLGHGVIYVYDQDKRPGKNTWSQTQIITSSKLYGLGLSKVVVNKDLLVASTTSHGPVLFRKVDGEYNPEQILGVNMGTSSFDVYDNVIALGATGVARGAFTNVGAVYILGSAKPPPLKGKPMPIQWSVQQVLYPTTPASSLYFGSSISLDKNKLAVLNGQSATTNDAFIFERSTTSGKWSVQQKLTDPSGAKSSYVFLRDSELMMIKNSSTIAYYDQYSTASCLIIAVEDQFGDGWDLARLVATAPDGSKEYYSSRCDLDYSHNFRYCPAKISLDGIYHFDIIDAASKSKNFWEIQWRVYDESKGVWYVGDHATKMDFEWDSEYHTFTPRKMERVLTSNATCHYCPPVPTYKPTPVTRRLKGGDDTNWPNTKHPTSTPAPTFVNTNVENWRLMTLNGANKWFNLYKTASYYVSDAKSRRLVASGTLCPGEATGKKCWVDLPDGYYNIRVGGALLPDPNAPTWSFCRASKLIKTQTQISVKIQDGDCIAMSRHVRASFCEKTIAAASLLIEFMILGVAADSLASDDLHALKNSISYAFPGLSADDVNLASVVPSSGGLFVSANVEFTSAMGYDVLSIDGLEAITQTVQTYMTTSGPKAIWSGLQSSEHRTVFSSSTAVQFVSVQLTGSNDKMLPSAVVADEVVNYYDETTFTYEEKTQSNLPTLLLNAISSSGYFLAVMAVAALVVGMFVSLRRSSSTTSSPSSNVSAKDYTELEATEHTQARPRDRVQLKDLNLTPLKASDLKSFVESEDEVLKMMLARGK